MKEIKLTINNAATFNSTLSGFLKKFSNLDKSILMKMYSTKIDSTMSNIHKSVVKFHETSISDLITVHSNWDFPLYVPLIISERFTRALDFFGDSSVDITIKYDGFEDKEVALVMEFSNSTLNMELTCSKITHFKISVKITDEIFQSITDTSNALYSLELPVATINKLKALASSNSSDEIYFVSNNKGVFFKGDAFEYKIGEPNGSNTKFGFQKHNIKNIDNEDYTLFVLEGSAIYKSMKANNTVVLSSIVE